LLVKKVVVVRNSGGKGIIGDILTTTKVIFFSFLLLFSFAFFNFCLCPFSLQDGLIQAFQRPFHLIRLNLRVRD